MTVFAKTEKTDNIDTDRWSRVLPEALRSPDTIFFTSDCESQAVLRLRGLSNAQQPPQTVPCLTVLLLGGRRVEEVVLEAVQRTAVPGKSRPLRFSARRNENIEGWGPRSSIDLLDEPCLDSGSSQSLLIHDTVVVQRIALLDLDERRRETGMRGRHERVRAYVTRRRAVHIYRRVESSIRDPACHKIYKGALT